MKIKDKYDNSYLSRGLNLHQMMMIHNRSAVTLWAGIEETFLAIMKDFRLSHTQMTLSFALELRQAKLMLIVASLQR